MAWPKGVSLQLGHTDSCVVVTQHVKNYSQANWGKRESVCVTTSSKHDNLPTRGSVVSGDVDGTGHTLL